MILPLFHVHYLGIILSNYEIATAFVTWPVRNKQTNLFHANSSNFE